MKNRKCGSTAEQRLPQQEEIPPPCRTNTARLSLTRWPKGYPAPSPATPWHFPLPQGPAAEAEVGSRYNVELGEMGTLTEVMVLAWDVAGHSGWLCLQQCPGNSLGAADPSTQSPLRPAPCTRTHTPHAQLLLPKHLPWVTFQSKQRIEVFPVQ